MRAGAWVLLGLAAEALAAPSLEVAREVAHPGSSQKVSVEGLEPFEEAKLIWIDPTRRIRADWSVRAGIRGSAAKEFVLDPAVPPGAHRLLLFRRSDAQGTPSAEGRFMVVPRELPPYLIVVDPEGIEGTLPPQEDINLAVAGAEHPDDDALWVSRILEGGPQFLQLDGDRLAALEAAYARTGSEELLARPACLHDRQWLERVRMWAGPKVVAASRHGTLLWSLGRGLFLAKDDGSLDFCRSSYCMRAFADQLSKKHGYLEFLNRRWGTAFTSWERISPATSAQLLSSLRLKGLEGSRAELAQWSDHRRFLDRTWAEALDMCRDAIRAVDRAPVGLEGLSLPGVFTGADPHLVLNVLGWASLSADQPTLALARALAPKTFIPFTDAVGADPEGAMWKGIVHGHRGAIVSGKTLAGLLERSRPALERLSNELGVLLQLASWEPDPLAVLYSHRSVQTEWALRAASGRKDVRAGAALAAWTQMMADLGFSAQVLDVEALRRRALSGVRALILPRMLVLSPDAADTCVRFVRAGGTAVADSGAGLLDENFARPKAPRLDELFGIARGEGPPPDGPISALHTGTIGGYIDGVELGALRPAEGGISAKVGMAFAESDGSACLVRNPFGRGMGIYLNVAFEDYPALRAGREGANLRRLVKNVLELAQVRPRVEVLAGGRPLDGCERSFLRLEETELLVLHLDRALAQAPNGMPVQAELVFDGPGYCYDSIAGVLLGSGDRVRVTLRPGTLGIFARLPYDVEGISIRVEERRPGSFRFKAVVETTTGLAWTHVLGQTLLSPEGRALPGSRVTLIAERGIARGELELAPGDPEGDYRLVLRDAATGVTGEVALPKRSASRLPTSVATPDSGGSRGGGSASP